MSAHSRSRYADMHTSKMADQNSTNEKDENPTQSDASEYEDEGKIIGETKVKSTSPLQPENRAPSLEKQGIDKSQPRGRSSKKELSTHATSKKKRKRSPSPSSSSSSDDSTSSSSSYSPSPKRKKKSSKKRRRSPSSSSSSSSSDEKSSRRRKKAKRAKRRKHRKHRKHSHRRCSPSPSTSRHRSPEPQKDSSPTVPVEPPTRRPFQTSSDEKSNRWDLKSDLLEYLQSYLQIHLPLEEQKSITGPNPKPANITVVREADSYISTSLKGQPILKKYDKAFTAIQSKLGHILGPLCRLWTQASEATEELDLDSLLEAIEQTVVMTSQAINYVDHKRRLNALMAYFEKEKDMDDLLKKHESDFGKEDRFLFGEEFQKNVTGIATDDKKIEVALKKSNTTKPQTPKKAGTGSSGNTQPFRQGPRHKRRGEGDPSSFRRLDYSGNNKAGTTGKTTIRSTEEVSYFHKYTYLELPLSSQSSAKSFQVDMSLVHPLIRNFFPNQRKENIPLVAGRLRYFQQNWGKLTRDPNILNIVKGWKIPLVKNAVLPQNPNPIPFSKEEEDLVSLEIQKMLEKGCIKQTHPQQNQILSNLFVIPKKNGELRPVINLRRLNALIPYHRFKMETLQNLKQILQEGDLMIKLDLRDAYYAVPLSQESQHLVKFLWKGTLYKFICLCFGIGPAPRVFSKLMKVPISVLRRLNIRLVIYLDDIIILGQTRWEIEVAKHTTIFLLQQLGFVINFQKSNLNPSTLMEFLGVEIDSQKMSMFLPKEKVDKLISKCKLLLAKDQVKIREVSSLIGTLNSTAPAVLPAPLQYRYLQQQQIKMLTMYPSYETQFTLNQLSRGELKRWIQNLSLYNGKPIRVAPPDIVIATDAAKTGGWGAVCQGTPAGGQWNQEEIELHINQQELIACKIALQTFLKNKENISVHMLMDNTTAIAYLLKMGGTKNAILTEIAKEIWHFLLPKNITVTAEYIPSILNKGADFQSRHVEDSSQWKLLPSIFHKIRKRWGCPIVDLFASRLSFQVPQYFSWKPDPHALAADAFQQCWKKGLLYAFPPFCLIAKTIHKMLRDHSELILITPLWTTQTWYTLVMSRAVENPILIPYRKTLLTNPQGKTHPLIQNKKLRLVAWRLSGKDSKPKEYLKRLPNLSPQPGPEVREKIMNPLGRNLVAGVVGNKLIPFDAL